MNVPFNLSHRNQLWLTAGAAALGTASIISALNAYSSLQRRRRLANDVKQSLLANPARTLEDHHDVPHPEVRLHRRPDAQDEEYDEALILEHLSRNYSYFGPDAMSKIRKGRVAIVGLGGVGSHAAVNLARSGVQFIRLIDFDYVTLSSLNRHACATLKDVGVPKVECARKWIRDIARWVKVDARVELWKNDFTGEDLLRDVDWVVDAIDNIETKVDLIRYCHEHNIKIISSSGSALKRHPSMVAISDISKTSYDPLARAVRIRLRKAGITTGVPVVYSSEHPDPELQLLPLPEDEYQNGSVNELSALEGFRVRILPVIGTLPAVFGCHAATYVLAALAGKTVEEGVQQFKKRNRREVTGNEATIENNLIELEGDEFERLYGDDSGEEYPRA